MTEIAIWARGVCKTYGKGNGAKQVLDNLDMTVKKGSIYGLLGASGCGKTTLLSTIVGSKPIDSGEIRVFGKLPGKTAVHSIGYMPQDIALVEELSIFGAIEHFGWIHGLTNEEIENRYQFLSKLLDLPPAKRLIKNLSGGQQRRVSLAVVLVHNPDILILDEPTVGLDPVLRQNIWDYLLQLTEVEKKTIIITTHYIEEARQAHFIGLMRNGKLLTEGTPDGLLNKYNCTNVEDVFLLLSRKQQEGNISSPEISSDLQLEDISISGNVSDTICQEQFTDEPTSFSSKIKKIVKFTNSHHAKALVTKNLYRLMRNNANLAYLIGFPILQMTLFLVTVGGDPNTIKLGIVNPELAPYTDCHEYAANMALLGGTKDQESGQCNYTGLSCKFILGLTEHLSHHVYYDNALDAKKGVQAGFITGYLQFGENFTEMTGRLRDNQAVTEPEVEQLQINVEMDKSSYPVTIYLEKLLLERYEQFSQEIETECGYSPKGVSIPIQKLEAVYSSYDAKFSEFMAPGFMLTVSIFLAVSLSALTIVTERTEGIWERTLVSGVSTSEIVIFHFIIMSMVNILQNIVLFVITFVIFQVECRGNLMTVMCLISLQGIVGIAMGTFVSVISKTVSDCILIALGMFYPFVVMSGITWPMEGMHPIVRALSYYGLPSAMSVEAMANVINRGWSFLNFNVAKGFLSSVGWCIFFNTLNVIVLKMKGG